MELTMLLMTGGLPLPVLVGFLPTLWAWCWLPVLVVRTGRLPMGAHGMAVLNFVFIRKGIDANSTPSYSYVYRHEFGHVCQMRRFSPWGVALFLGGWYFWQCIMKRKAFAKAWRFNPLERH